LPFSIFWQNVRYFCIFSLSYHQPNTTHYATVLFLYRFVAMLAFIMTFPSVSSYVYCTFSTILATIH